jgi:hypothetical protein
MLLLLRTSQHPSPLHLQNTWGKSTEEAATRAADLKQRRHLQRLRNFDDFIVAQGKAFHVQQQHLQCTKSYVRRRATDTCDHQLRWTTAAARG